MINRVAFSLGVLLSAGPAFAINKCTAPDGKVSFQETSCAVTDKADGVRAATGVSTDASTGSERSRKGVEDANSKIAIRLAINERRPAIGMTFNQLEQALGLPQSINSGTYASGSTQQRVFYFNDVTWYVYVKDGLVTSFQSTSGGLGKTTPVTCPTGLEIRNVETSASSNTLTDERRRQYTKQLNEMRSCGK